MIPPNVDTEAGTTGDVLTLTANGMWVPGTPIATAIPTVDNTSDLGDATHRWRRIYLGTSAIFQGAAFKVTLACTPAVADKTITVPPETGTLDLLEIAQSFSGVKTFAASPLFTDNAIDLGDATHRVRSLYLGTGVRTPLVATPDVATSGVQTALTVTGAADTGQTAATEKTDVYLNLGRSVTWAAGAGPLALQRAFRIAAPTYVGDAGGALTITDAATVYISGAPVQGANMTLTRTHALWVAAGRTRLGGDLQLDSTLTVPAANTETAGQATVTGPATTQAVVLASIAANDLVLLTPLSNPASAAGINHWWVTVNAGVGFTINMGAAPSNPCVFGWTVIRRP